MRLTSIVHILSPETDNCPPWITGTERMTVENISWSLSTKECCRPRRRSTRDLLVSSRTRIQLSYRGRHKELRWPNTKGKYGKVTDTDIKWSIISKSVMIIIFVEFIIHLIIRLIVTALIIKHSLLYKPSDHLTVDVWQTINDFRAGLFI